MSLSTGNNKQTFTATDRGLLDLLASLVGRGAVASQHTPDPQQLRLTIFQTAHGFAAKDPVYYDATGSASWKKALASDTSDSLLPQGIVESAATNVFTVVLVGMIRGLTGLTQGTSYWLAAAGGLTSTAPSSPNRSILMLKALSTTTGIVQRAVVKLDISQFLALKTYGAATSYTSPGSATHTFTAGKTWALIEIIGAGGGGAGGTNPGGSNAVSGGGGGQGERQYFLTPITATTAAIVVGAKGTGGALNTDGTDGGNSSVTMNGIGVTAEKGTKGLATGRGGFGGNSDGIIASVGFNIAIPGNNGESGHVSSIGYNGTGNILAVQTRGGTGGGNVTAGVDVGAGGQGGSVSTTGGPGNDGRVKIWEA